MSYVRWDERGSGTFFLLDNFDRPWLTLRWRIRVHKVSFEGSTPEASLVLMYQPTVLEKSLVDRCCIHLLFVETHVTKNQVDIKVYLGSEPPVGEAYLGNIVEPNLDIWYSACLALDTSRREVSLAVNGNLLSDKIPLGNVDSSQPTTLQGRLYIGAWYEHSTETKHQFSGSISNIQVYSQMHLDEIHCNMS